jgi:hypothetical protein
MILRRSRFIHQLPVGKDRTLIVHAISHMRLPADRDIGALVDHFAEPRRIPEDCDAMTALFPSARDTPADNAKLHVGEMQCTGAQDLLFPEDVQPAKETEVA